MVNPGVSLLRDLGGQRRAWLASQGRLSLLVGSCGVVLATNGGCLETPHRTVHKTNGGQSAGAASGFAGSAGLGGSSGGATLGGGMGTTPAGGGSGHRPRPSGSGGSSTTPGEAGAANDAGGASDTGGTGHAGSRSSVGGSGQMSGGGDDAGGEAGMESAAGASNGIGGQGGMSGGGGSGGLSPTGGVAGTSQAGTSAGGFAGNNGGDVEEPFTGPCPGSVIDGWATVAGLGFDPAANGVTATEVVVTDADSLVSYASSPDPYVIRISGTIAVPALDVTSNKTIMGDDASAVFQGGIRLLGTSTDPSNMISNVVIKNLSIDATTSATATTADEDDGIMVAYAHHVWIDHVDVWDASGDDLSVSNGSDYITVSWSKFRFVNGVRRTAARVGHSDTNGPEDSGHLNVTFHHNWWTDNVDQRMPRVRFGAVHVFDNYYSNRNTNYPDNTYCIAAGYEADILVENNFFDEAYNPHVFFSFQNGVASYSEPTAQMVVDGNTYVGVSDLANGKQSGQGAGFVPPYSVTLEPADDTLRNTIRHCAGVAGIP